jgi:hypothetical protein
VIEAVTPVAAWPNHGTGEIVTVGSDGQVYTLPVLDDGKLVASAWLRRGPPLPGSQADRSLGGKVAKFTDAIYEWHTRNTGSPEIILAAPTEIDAMAHELENLRGFVRPKNPRTEILGIELAPSLSVGEGVAVLVDRDMKVLGAVRIP